MSWSRRITGSIAVLALLGLAWFVAWEAVRKPDLEHLDYAAMAIECEQILRCHPKGQAIVRLEHYPHVRKLSPVEVVVEESGVLIILRNRIGLRCLKRIPDGAWVFSCVGDASTQELAVIAPAPHKH